MSRLPPANTRSIAPLQTNPEAERAFLACLMRNPALDTIIDNGITADHFTSRQNREAFEAIAAFLADGTIPDAAILRSALSDATLIEIETSLRENASAANAYAYAKLLKAAKRERAEATARDRLSAAIANGAPPHEMAAIVESIRLAGQAADESAPRFQWAEDFCENRPSAMWLVDSYIQASTVGVFFGDSEAWKSFLLIDLCGHIACGLPWRGHDVKQGKVLFIAGEGGGGLHARIKAWFDHHGEPMRNFAVSTVPLELCDPKNVDALIADIRGFVGDDQIQLIVLDTLNTHFGAGDENKTEDMTRFRLSASKLGKATGATIAIAHHPGHNDKTREKGAIALRQGIDWSYRVERVGDITTISATKTKDAHKPPPLSWTLVQQPLPWADAKGAPINGAVLSPVDLVPGQPRTKSRLSGKTAIAEKALRDALIRHGVENAGIVSVTEDEWRHAAYSAGVASDDATQDARRKAFSRARETLLAMEYVACLDGRYWIPVPGHTRTYPDIPGQMSAVVRVGIEHGHPDRTGHTSLEVSGLSGLSGCAGQEIQSAKDSGGIAAEWRNSGEGPPITESTAPATQGTDGVLSHLGKAKSVCLPRDGYPFGYLTECDRPTPIANPAGHGNPVGCSNCGAKWGRPDIAQPSAASPKPRNGITGTDDSKRWGTFPHNPSSPSKSLPVGEDKEVF